MRPIIPLRRPDLVVPIGIGTGFVEASSSVWKRAAERFCVEFGDLVRWAFDERAATIPHSPIPTGQLALDRRLLGIDGLTMVAERYIDPLRRLVASDQIDSCTLLSFSGLVSEKNLLRRDRAWCPLCLKEMLTRESVYEPLLWRLRDVSVCPFHRINLVQVCPFCKSPHQDVISRYSRVGCCGRCGKWLGIYEDMAVVHRCVDDPAVKSSHTILNLLEHTADFDNQGHDGRFSFRKFVTSREMCALLASALASSPEQISRYVFKQRLPRLWVLATISCVSEQPLHHVILGQLNPWTESHTPIIKAKRGKPRHNWITIERKFKNFVIRSAVINLQDACRRLNISASSARVHFPDLVKQLVQKGKALKTKKSEAKLKASLECFRNAFRTLIEAGIYPSIPKLEKMTGIDFRHISYRHKTFLDEEWKRVESVTHLRRRKRTFRRSHD